MELSSVQIAASAVVATLTLIYLYMTRNYNHWQKKGIPHLKPVPLIGNIADCLLLRRSIGDFLGDLYRKTKEDVLGFYVFDRPYLLVRSPELIKHILIKDFSYFYNRVVANNHNTDPIGSSILFLIKNPEWRTTRLKMAPVFTSGKLKGMFGLVNEVGYDLQDYMRKHIIGKDVVECKEICAKYTTDVITSCAFGLNAHCFEDDDAVFRIAGKKIYGFEDFWRGVQMNIFFFSPLLVKLLGLKFFDPWAAAFLKKTFLATMAEREKSKVVRNDLIDILIEINALENKPIDETILVAQAAQWFVAGFETTSSTISGALYELSKQPELQERLRKEITTILAKHGKINFEAMNEMKYLSAVINETLRMYPSLPFLDRRAMQDYQLPGTDIVIEKGTPLFIPLMGLHFDEEYHPNPEKFDPERFYNEENVKNRVPFTFLPFGNGPHNCVGERFALISTKLGLIHILSQFNVDMTPETPQKLEYDPIAFLIKPIGGIPMRFREVATMAA